MIHRDTGWWDRPPSRTVLAMTPTSTSPPSSGPAVLRRINPTTWSAPFGYDQGQLRTGASAILTIAGQGSVDAAGRLLHHGDPAAQLALTLANVEGVLSAAGMAFADLAQVRVYVTDMAAALDVYDLVVEHLRAAGATPPTTLVEVSRLAIPGMTVEIDAIAIR